MAQSVTGPIVRNRVDVHAPTINPRVRLLPEDKLDVLRRLDQFRQWGSLDDERQCLGCGKIISGRQIEVSGGTRGYGPIQLHCPTEGCKSIPIDWTLVDNSVRTTSMIVPPMFRSPTKSAKKAEFSLSEQLKELQGKLKSRRARLAHG